jgi:short-subunit dehydrogenase
VRTEQVVVITGASSGIGRATALRFAKDGASLVLASRREDALTELAAACRALGARATAVPTDVTDEQQVAALAEEAVTRFGRIDVWINDAAVAVFAPLVEAPIDEVKRVLDVNVMGYLYGARAALEVMVRQGSGVLLNVASIAGEVPYPYAGAYAMSKAAVRAMGVSLRGELRLAGATGVHVATVSPPTVDTPFFQHAANHTGRRVLAMPPVYGVDQVAAAIVRTARHPKDEVVIGRIAKTLVRQHRRTPRPVEAQLAAQVQTTHLSLTQSAPDTTGNLFAPSDDPDGASATGGWAGRTRTAGRLVIGLGVASLGAFVVAQRMEARSR